MQEIPWYRKPAPSEHEHRNMLRDVVAEAFRRAEFKGFTAKLVSDDERVSRAIMEPNWRQNLSAGFSKLPFIGRWFFQGLGHQHEVGLRRASEVALRDYNTRHVIPNWRVDSKTNQIRLEFTNITPTE